MPGILVTASVVAFGYLAGLVIHRRGGLSVGPVHLLALAPGLGLGLLSLSLFFLLHFELDKRGLWWIFAALLVLLGVLWRFRAPTRDDEPVERPRSSKKWRALWGTLLLITLYVLSVRAWREFNQQPVGTLDAIAIWNARSVLLFRAESGHKEIFQRIERGGAEYPLFLPSALAGQYVLRGGEGVEIPQALDVVFLLGWALLVYLGVSHLGTRRMALPAVLLVLSTPVVSRWAFSQGADLIMAYLALATAFALWTQLPVAGRHEEPPNFSPLVAGFFLGLLAWTKSEGAVLAVIMAFVFLVFRISRGLGRDVMKRLGWTAAGALPGFLALILFKLSWAPTREIQSFLSNISEKLGDAGRWKAIVAGVWERFDPLGLPEYWGILWPFLVIGLTLAILKGAPDIRHVYLVAVFGAAVLAYLSFYLITPADVVWHIKQSLDRLLFQLFALLVVSVFGAIQPAD